MRLSQIALSVTDLRRSQHWYREVIGLRPAGGTNLFFGPLATMVQGIPHSASTCWWLVDRQDLFQLELFEFRSPLVRRLPEDWTPADVGFTTVTYSVSDLDATLDRARAAGAPPVTDPIGPAGARRACIRDPDGVLVELAEDDPRGPSTRERPRPEIPAVARAITLSVDDLEASRHFLVDVLDLHEAEDIELHGPQHEAMWELEGASRESLLLWADDFLVEVVHYTDPAGRPRPPGYRISDQGILNIAFGFRSRRGFDDAVERCRDAGYQGNGSPLHLGAWSVIYVNDGQGFSFELLHAEPWYEGQMGFRPGRTPALAPFVGRTPARTRSERRFTRALVTGAAGGIGAELARLLSEDGTSLVLADRDAEALRSLEAELSGRVDLKTLGLDLTDLEAVDEAAEELAGDVGDLDLVAACAGLDRAQSLLAFDWRQARDDFSVNTLANLVLLGRLIPPMAERGRGHVTALVSLAGLVGMPYEAPYSGSKAALAAIVESARAELAPKGLTFTAVFPGFVDTPMFRQNAFKHTYSIDARDAAERIYMATLRRKETLAFPKSERAKLGLARILPPRVRDRMTRSAMNPPAGIESRG